MKYLTILVFGLISIAFAVPPSPEMLDQLKASGNYETVINALRQARLAGVDQPNPMPPRIKPGDRLEVKAIAILVDFSDNVGAAPAAHFDTILSSQAVYSTGSMRDFYLENSYNAVDLVTTVVGWLRMPQTYAYYVNGNYGWGGYPQNCQRLTEDAVWAANPYVDFSQFDNNSDGYIDALFIIHAGPGAEETGDPNDIWSHAWCTVNVPYVDGVYAYSYSTEPENGRIGVYCHEAGHAVFGLPDLYDYDYDSYGVGNWSVMSFGSWGNNGRRPTHLDAWSKCDCGFVVPHVVTVNTDSVMFPRVEYTPVIEKLWSYGAPTNEFIMVENRQKVGFDNYLPSSGMLIWHVDENQSGNDNQWYPGYTDYGHYKVALEQADGLWQMEQNINAGNSGDPYPGSTGSRFYNDSTTPDSKDYNFNITYVAVENVTNSDDTMWADLKVWPVGVSESRQSVSVPLTLEFLPGNPVRNGSSIVFKLPGQGPSILSVYDRSGAVVYRHENNTGDEVTWDLNAQSFRAGIYFARLERASGVGTAKIVIIQ
jgi:immune inhibitor A